jgi:DNA-directed RNA polymerase subunit omega
LPQEDHKRNNGIGARGNFGALLDAFCFFVYILSSKRTLRELNMILPLDLLIEYQGNIYELTCAAIRRAYQVTITGDEELEKNQGKVVPTAIKQILTRKVIFQLEE